MAALRTAFICAFVACWMSVWLNSASGQQEYLPPKTGKKAQSEAKTPANYNYTYNVEDPNVQLDFGHTERRREERVSGSYHVLLPDGRMQLVEYEAGADGYKPLVMYMGTASYPTQKADKFDGYHYNAASSRQTVRASARGVRPPAPAPPARPPAPAPPAPPPKPANNVTKAA